LFCVVVHTNWVGRFRNGMPGVKNIDKH